MSERLTQEIALIREWYPSLQHGEQFDWVLIPEYPLPKDRFNKSHTCLLFRIPVGYPSTGPDDFFVDNDLRLVDGSAAPRFNAGPDSSSGPAPVSGDWGWFSWHPQSWRVAATVAGGDNLLTFLKSVDMCLKGLESS